MHHGSCFKCSYRFPPEFQVLTKFYCWSHLEHVRSRFRQGFSASNVYFYVSRPQRRHLYPMVLTLHATHDFGEDDYSSTNAIPSAWSSQLSSLLLKQPVHSTNPGHLALSSSSAVYCVQDTKQDQPSGLRPLWSRQKNLPSTGISR
jgi:hypothetical protein